MIGLPISVPMAAARKLPPIAQQIIAAMIKCNPSMGLKLMNIPVAKPRAMVCGLALIRRKRCHT